LGIAAEIKKIKNKKTQAGFALGIAAEIATQFPTWGRKFQVNYVKDMNK